MNNDLTLEDYHVIAMLITAGSQRGMYKPEELATVGALYAKVAARIQESQQSTPEATTEDKPEEGESND